MQIPYRIKSAFDLKIILTLAVLVVCGLVLRLYQSENGIIFGYDQARDAFRAQSIIRDHNLKLLGPETDIPGAHHGVGYYYILALAYGINGDPINAISFMAIIHALGVILIYAAGYLFFKSKRTAIIASIIFIFSYEMIQYARWLSNPSLAIFPVIMTYLGLWLWIKGNSRGLILSLISIALCLHFQLFLAYMFLLPVAVYIIYRPKLNYKHLVTGLLSAAIIDITFLIAEFKFNFQTFKAFQIYFSGQSQNYKDVSGFILLFINRFISVVFHTLAPYNSVIAFIIGICFVIMMYKYRKSANDRMLSIGGFLFFWLISTFPVFIFSTGALNSEFGMLTASTALIFISAFLLEILSRSKSWKNWVYVLIFLFLAINIRFTLVHAQDGSYIFSVQGPMTYGREKEILDYTYHEAAGKPFSICTITNPLFVNTTWAYMYQTYGQNHYGYLPYWSGADQNGQLGNLPVDTVKPKLRYLIMEPSNGIPTHVQAVYFRLEDYVSNVLEEKKFGEFTVQKRLLLTSEEMEKRKATYSTDYNLTSVKEDNILFRCYN